MSGFIKPLRKVSKKIDPLYEWNPAPQIGEAFEPQKIPDPIPPPTIDEAQRNRQDQDRLRRRRGVLANIYGGGSGSAAPSVGKATLGG